MGELDEEAIKAEDDLCSKTIPYRDRVLVKLRQATPEVHASGLVEATDRTAMKYSKEAIEGTVVRSGGQCNTVGAGDRVWLDKKTWNPSARYVLVREKDILAHEPATGEWDATATTGWKTRPNNQP